MRSQYNGMAGASSCATCRARLGTRARPVAVAIRVVASLADHQACGAVHLHRERRTMNEPGRRWQVGPDQALSLDRPRIMGILNVTPDSFFDGGAYATTQSAIDAALRMHADGAAIVDIGGESTRPG